MILCNGDSNTIGAELDDHESRFADIVANYFHLGIKNIAVSANSNAAITRSTISYLEKHPRPTFILIGWTTWEREEWQHQGEWYQVNFGGPPLIKEWHSRWRHWIDSLPPDNMQIRSREWHSKIHEFHSWLQDQAIPHLFFNCYMPLTIESSQHLDWHDCYIDPYDAEGTYYKWCVNRGCRPTQGMHLKGDGHAQWAQRLIQHITDHDLIRQRG